jgi:molecular chaperone DnaJ
MNPYEELGVAADATEAQIRSAYRKKATKAHPDKGGSGEAFARTTKALAVLTNPKSRKRFDETFSATSATTA